VPVGQRRPAGAAVGAAVVGAAVGVPVSAASPAGAPAGAPDGSGGDPSDEVRDPPAQVAVICSGV
jgi:hypothetical protein